MADDDWTSEAEPPVKPPETEAALGGDKGPPSAPSAPFVDRRDIRLPIPKVDGLQPFIKLSPSRSNVAERLCLSVMPPLDALPDCPGRPDRLSGTGLKLNVIFPTNGLGGVFLAGRIVSLFCTVMLC